MSFSLLRDRYGLGAIWNVLTRTEIPTCVCVFCHTCTAWATVIRTADTAIPISPTRCSDLRPALSTKNSCNGDTARKTRVIHLHCTEQR